MKTSVFLMAMAIATAAGGAASAQQVMDGSDKTIDEATKKAMLSSLVSATRDPFSAQIIKLKFAKSRQDLVCGEVNLKNSFGAYTGFQPFGFNTQYNNILMNQNLTDCAE